MRKPTEVYTTIYDYTDQHLEEELVLVTKTIEACKYFDRHTRSFADSDVFLFTLQDIKKKIEKELNARRS